MNTMVKDKKYILDGKRILTYDVGFKSVFGRSTELMARLISIITGIEYDILKDNIILIVNEIPIIRKNEKFKKCDFIVRIGESGIINLELNHYSNSFSRRKNFSYITSLYGRRTTTGSNYELNILLNQININAFNTDKNTLPLETYKLKEEKTNKTYYEEDIEFKIFEFNIAKCYQLYYNDIKLRKDPVILLGTLLYCTSVSEMGKISSNFLNKEENEIFMDNVKSLYDDSDLLTIEELTRMEQACYNSEKKAIEEQAKKKGLEEGLQEGLQQGIESKSKEIIDNMLKQGFKHEVISSITGKSIEEIKKIANKK